MLKVLIFKEKLLIFMGNLIFTEFIIIFKEYTKNQEFFFSKMSTFKSLV